MPSKESYQQNPLHYAKYAREWSARNRDRVNQQGRERHRRVRERVLLKYGGKCQCCGVSQYEFLAIDHVRGGGCKERREKHFPNSQAFYNYLDKQDKSDKYQILCHNCNSAKSFYGGCPHMKDISETKQIVGSSERFALPFSPLGDVEGNLGLYQEQPFIN
jgi:hypothetical protein